MPSMTLDSGPTGGILGCLHLGRLYGERNVVWLEALTDDDLQRLEIILSLARDLGVNISGISIILDMRARMEEMQRQMHEFLAHFQQEMLAHMTQADASKGALIPVRRTPFAPAPSNSKEKK